MYYYVYVIESEKNGKLYVGCTKDLKQRLKSHNAGQVSSTERYRPYTLIYCEVYKNKYDAYKREKFLKTGWGRNYLKRVLRNYFLSKKLGG